MRPSTYSIVACDLARGEWGVGVQSKFLAVGSVVAWAAPGVGAIATQASAKVSYGPDGLGLLRSGLAAGDVVDSLTGADDGRQYRQLGVVDAAGRAVSFTGASCLPWAGGLTGDGYAAQGNILVSGETVSALARAFEESAGRPLAERLLASLQAGQAAGGDRRGQQSSALYVVKEGGGYDGWDVAVDLRVDDHAAPIDELERLYALHQLYFGETPEDEWLAVEPALAGELRTTLDRLGFSAGDLAKDLEAWAGVENLEERVRGAERIDPLVLAVLRDS
ncbi:MAG: DUF1028 domain-containing protein [Gaiellales bacterium]